MVLPPARLAPHAAAPRPGGASWLAACVDSRRGDREEQCLLEALRPEPDLPRPSLSVVDATTSRAHAAALHAPEPAGGPGAVAAPARRPPVAPRLEACLLSAVPRRLHADVPPRHAERGPISADLDHNGRAFGGFAPVAWHASDRYFGDGETFVFRLRDPLPKPVVPLIDQAKLLELVQGGPAPDGGGSRRTDGKIAEEAMQRAVQLLSDWHLRVRAEAERADRAALEGNSVTSMTEALDEVLGHDGAGAGSEDNCARSPRDAATSRQRRRRANLQHCYTATPVAVKDVLVRTESSSSGNSGGATPDTDGEEHELDGDAGLEVFHWSGEDPFFLFSDMECLAFGGGSAFALYVESDLLHGMSEESSTFQSDMLSSEKDFVIANLECWVFDDPSEVA
ncbi:unnamed protein product [Prorocentrum cordatum]|nr:unnamed protein product [Polarella glacialis]